MGILAFVIGTLILRPIQVLFWAPLRAFVFFYIHVATGIPRKIRQAKKLSENPWTSLDSYDPLLLVSATELARRIRAGELSSEAVVKAYIRRIQKVNPLINAVVANRFETAILEARNVDRLVARDGLPNGHSAQEKPFWGVPITVKESIAVQGMPNTYGLVWRTSGTYSPAQEHSVRAQKLIDAGFIILGVTNICEALMTGESDNRVYGRTFNPYDLARNPGGSSSGEGAIVGAAGSVIGVGTDLGGSIRMPAFFCGVFGHKTTAEWIPKEKPNFMSPLTAEKAACSSTGPLCRYAEDMAPFVSALIGRDIGDPRSIDLSKLRVVAFPDGLGHSMLISKLDPALHTAVIDVTSYLAQQVVGQENVIMAQMPSYISQASVKFGPMIATGERTLPEILGGEGMPHADLTRELASFIKGSSNYTGYSFQNHLLRILPTPKGTREQVVPFWNKLRDHLETLMGENGVMIFPPHPCVARPHGTDFFNRPNLMYTAIFNALGFPATQVPLGLNKDGLPLGVQVIARKGDDLKTIAVAIQLEKRFGGWTPPRRFGAPLPEHDTEKLYNHRMKK
ncbi:Fatty-acid amide hydrolase 2 [Linderina pennispora]|nr:Fatty-acid amide hydrolase 2 [Linderina pennispora]